jgi:hypothetical protein
MPKDLELDDIDATLAQRGQQYKDNWVSYVALKQAAADCQTSKLSDKQQYCIDMMLMKISRILQGNPNKADTWHDIEGYAKLGKPSVLFPPAMPSAPAPNGTEVYLKPPCPLDPRL